MLIGVRGILGFVCQNFGFFLIFWTPGSPNRLKNMPRGVGSISTPADFLSASFKILKFPFFWTRGPQHFRTWGPQRFRTWGPQQDMGSGVLDVFRTRGPQQDLGSSTF